MKFLEKELEDIIWESDKYQLEERGLSLFGNLFRQMAIGNYGIADIIQVKKAYSNNKPYLMINILELKQDKIGISAFLQAVKYAKGVQSYFKKRGLKNYILNITIIGKEVDISGSICFLPDLIESNKINYGKINSVKFITYEYTLDGLYFNESKGYALIKEGFSNER